MAAPHVTGVAALVLATSAAAHPGRVGRRLAQRRHRDQHRPVRRHRTPRCRPRPSACKARCPSRNSRCQSDHRAPRSDRDGSRVAVCRVRARAWHGTYHELDGVPHATQAVEAGRCSATSRAPARRGDLLDPPGRDRQLGQEAQDRAVATSGMSSSHARNNDSIRWGQRVPLEGTVFGAGRTTRSSTGWG